MSQISKQTVNSVSVETRTTLNDDRQLLIFLLKKYPQIVSNFLGAIL